MSENKLKVLVAPNSMKGSLNAFEFADVVEKAFMRISPCFEIMKVPVADGGDFTGEVLKHAFRAIPVEVEVNDPLGRPVASKYFRSGSTAIIEMADASGIKLLKQPEFKPMETSSYGTGELIVAAIEAGCTEVLLGVGGSATVDGGAGMMEAFGYRYMDDKGEYVEGNGGNLIRINTIKKINWYDDVSIKIITDVENPLLGVHGAATVFGPQKGATSKQVKVLEAGLSNWCNLIEKDSGIKLFHRKGAGAAGGIAVPLLAWTNAKIVSGAEFILAALDFEEHVNRADIVITGEGRIDMQTLSNKAPKAVADAAQKAGKPVIAIGGSVDAQASNPFTAGAFSFLNGPVSLDDAIENAAHYLDQFSEQLAKLLLICFKK